ncbi:hypothetical protein FQB35_02025 [Crassaminicella thermophila]|uniref:Uncharacterized protein n=2 Tax=Crassaminicella thermophila TaxID=2599308 RepID=A0A5C0SBE8_CRATE|nr:hypothetical protein FQB35_02025 [Crassaminicella thermophila]
MLLNKKINKKRLALSGLLLAISTYIVRLLPIHFGVHTMIIIMLYIFFTVKINNMHIMESIPICIISMIIIFICDWIIVLFYVNILHLDFIYIFKEPVKSAIYSIPSLIMTFFIVLMIFCIKKYRNKKVDSHVSDRKSI